MPEERGPKENEKEGDSQEVKPSSKNNENETEIKMMKLK